MAIGWTRPWRESSARVHMSLTGLPIAFDTCAASSAASWKSLRPNDPPPWITCTVTAPVGRPSFFAMSFWATIGFFNARPDLRLAVADVGDGAVGLQRGVAAEVEREGPLEGLADTGRHGQRQLRLAQAGEHRLVVLARDGAGLPGHLHRADRFDALAERLGADRDAGRDLDDVGDAGHRRGRRRRCRCCPGAPLRSGARQMTVGSASGIFRSVVNFLRPMTMSRASVLPCGLPMMRKSLRSFSTTSTASVDRAGGLLGELAERQRLPVQVGDEAAAADERVLVLARRTAAAASSSRPAASAAATRMAV